ncbi:aldehyde dehydrogenase family protein [Rhodococcus koreensis]
MNTDRFVEANPYIAGSFVEPTRPKRFGTVSPATGERLGDFALCGPEDVERAVAAARDACEAWAALTVFDRCAHLEELIDEIIRRRADLGRILALEQGKPYQSEALAEIDETIANFRTAIDLGKYLDGAMPTSARADRRALAYRVPRGVVAAIQPWNFPLGTASAQIAPALVTGNTVVALPAPSTTLVEYEFARCFEAVGIPAGVFNLVTGLGSDIGDTLTGHPNVQVVVFTGSVATGQRVASRAAGKAQLIELGGNGPFVVLEDADLDLAIPDALRAAFGGAGQSCTAAGRFLVHEAIYDEWASRLIDAVTRNVRLGTPFDDDTTMGPVNNHSLADRLDKYVESAIAAGAVLLTGGRRAEGFPTDLYWQPTILAEVDDTMAVTVEETFGPIAPLQRISSDEEALALMHTSPYGLCSAVYTRDLGRGLKFAEKAPSGVVSVNGTPGNVETHMPFGGRAGKLSGSGRILGRHPMEEIFTETKLVIVRV